MNEFVEVFNMDFDADKVESVDLFRKFLETRLSKKAEEKFGGLVPNEIWQLVPVLWGDMERRIKFSRAFNYFKQFKMLSPFMTIAQYRDGQGHLVFGLEPAQDYIARFKALGGR